MTKPARYYVDIAHCQWNSARHCQGLPNEKQVFAASKDVAQGVRREFAERIFSFRQLHGNLLQLRLLLC